MARYDANYREEISLRDGTSVYLRMIGPGDGELLRRGFDSLSEHSRRRRFLMHKSSLSAAEIHALTSIDGRDHVAIGAGIMEDGRVVEPLAVARFVRLAPDDPTAEAAIAVVDEWQGRGLGGVLWRRLVDAARERGIRRFRVDMLAENVGMRRLTALLGPRDRLRTEHGVITADFRLPDPGVDGADSGAYRVFRFAAGDDET